MLLFLQGIYLVDTQANLSKSDNLLILPFPDMSSQPTP